MFARKQRQTDTRSLGTHILGREQNGCARTTKCNDKELEVNFILTKLVKKTHSVIGR